MTIAILGGFGQLGTALQTILGNRARSLSSKECNLLDAEQIDAVFQRLEPDCVINCAAYNFVDRAEDDPQRATAINSGAVKQLAKFCAARNVTLVHVSTDHVFGGDAARRTPYTEEDSPKPVSVYGHSKRGGEKFVAQLCPNSFIVRTCGLYGVARSAGKGNFVETILKIAGRQPVLKVVNDQTCTPTSAHDLALAIADLVETDAYGLYHATCEGETTWHGFATEILSQAEVAAEVQPISTAEFGARAPRPAYSVLDCSKLARLRGKRLPHWRESLKIYLQERESR